MLAVVRERAKEMEVPRQIGDDNIERGSKERVAFWRLRIVARGKLSVKE